MDNHQKVIMYAHYRNIPLIVDMQKPLNEGRYTNADTLDVINPDVILLLQDNEILNDNQLNG